MKIKSVRTSVSLLVVVIMITVSFAVTMEQASAASVKTAVKGVSATAKSYESIKVSWRKLGKSTGYRIYRATSLNGKYTKVKTVKGQKRFSWTNDDLSPTTTYYYKVRPINGKKYSAVASATTKDIPFTEKSPSVTLGRKGQYTTISWTDVEGADGYRVYRKNPGETKFKRIKQVSSGVTIINDRQGASGKMVQYKVRAYEGLILKEYSRYSQIQSVQAPFRVFIACGHGTDIAGRWDTGCTYNGMTEADLMFPITKQMVKALRASGVTVYTDVDNNNNKNMIACVTWANKRNISAYMSLHCDYSGAPKGTLPLYRTSEDYELAQALNEGVHSKVSIAHRGMSRRTDLYELNMPKVPSCIYEAGGIRYDYKIFRNKATKYGNGLAKGMCDYLGVEYLGN